MSVQKNLTPLNISISEQKKMSLLELRQYLKSSKGRDAQYYATLLE